MGLDEFVSLLEQSILSPAVTTYFFLALALLQFVNTRWRTDALRLLQARVALCYFIVGALVTLGALSGIDLAGSLDGTGAAVTPVAILFSVVAVALFQRCYLVAAWLLLVLLGFQLQLTGAENFWLYFVDPVALCGAGAFALWQRRWLKGLTLEPGTLQSWALIIIAVFLGYAIYLARVVPEEFRYALVVEDGFVEWTTVIVLLVTMSVCFHRVVTLRRQRSWLFLCVTTLLGLLCLFGAGEEISWGQRILGLESPEFFQANNAQGEIGLHNLVVEVDGERVKLNKLIFGTGLAVAMLIYLFVATPLYRRNDRVRKFFNGIAAPMPQNYQVVGYLAVVAAVELLIDHSKRGEMTEFAGAIMFALNVIYPDNENLFRTDADQPHEGD